MGTLIGLGYSNQNNLKYGGRLENAFSRFYVNSISYTKARREDLCVGSRSSELKVSLVWHLLALQRGGEGGGRALSTCAPLCPRRTGLWEGLTHACERSAFHFQHLFKTLCVGLSVSSRDSQKAHSPVGEKNVRYFSTRFAFLAPKDFSLTLFPKLSPSLPSSMKF